jgi:anti-anti-sigma regulatory factor
MANALSWKTEKTPRGTLFALSGEVTENTDFAPLVREDCETMILDLAGVARINSCGVREWITFVNSLASAGKKIVMERCSVPVVHQLNMVSNFRGGAEIHSAFAPYFCASCQAEHTRLIDLHDPAARRSLEDEVKCPICAAPMEFDDLPDSYLAFYD